MKFGLVCQRCNYTSYAHICAYTLSINHLLFKSSVWLQEPPSVLVHWLRLYDELEHLHQRLVLSWLEFLALLLRRGVKAVLVWQKPPPINIYKKIASSRPLYCRPLASWRSHQQRAPATTSNLVTSALVLFIINITRPKPPYGRQGLAGLWARIQSGGYILGRSQRLTSRLRRSARIGQC